MSLRIDIYNKGEEIPDVVERNIFHSKELFLIFEKTSGFKPFMFAVYDGERCLVRLLTYVQRDRSVFSHSFVKRCVVYGCGDFAPDLLPEEKDKAFEFLLNEFTQQMMKKAFVMEFRNLDNALFGYKAFHDNHFIPINWLRVRNSLHGNKNVDQRFSTSRLRQIRKGIKNGAVVEIAHKTDDVKAFAQMLKRVYSSHIRKYFPDKDFFHHLFDVWHNDGKTKIIIVRYKQKIIGGAVCLYSGENAYLWFSGGMRKTYPSQYPGVLSIWKALEDAQENGYQHFEFMDVGLPFRRHGFRDFVLRFGGKQSSTRRWFRFRWKWLNRFLDLLYS